MKCPAGISKAVKPMLHDMSMSWLLTSPLMVSDNRSWRDLPSPRYGSSNEWVMYSQLVVRWDGVILLSLYGMGSWSLRSTSTTNRLSAKIKYIGMYTYSKNHRAMRGTSVFDAWIPAAAFCWTLWITAHDEDKNRYEVWESEFWMGKRSSREH